MTTENDAEAPVTLEKSGDKVFADFGIPDVDTHLVKADLAFKIRIACEK